MSCSPIDLKDYFLRELSGAESGLVEEHLAACAVCREELDGLRATHSVLMALEQEEPPRRTAFVSDKVFEPRWWQAVWASASRLGFASAAMLAAAIVAHGVLMRPVPAPEPPQADTARIVEQRVEREIAKRLPEAIRQASLEIESREAERSAKLLAAAEKRLDFEREANRVAFEEAMDTMRKLQGRYTVASMEAGVIR